MKKKILLLVFLVLLAAGVLGGWLYHRHYQATYIEIDGQTYLRAETELDFRGKSITELDKLKELKSLRLLDLRETGLSVQAYENLCRALPECEILWSVPFQGGSLDMDLTELTVTRLGEEDVKDLRLLQQLKTLDATACADLEAVALAMETYPELEVRYTVPLGGEKYREDTTQLVVENADAKEMETALAYLPELTGVQFTGTAPDNETIYDWMVRYPEIVFQWDFRVCGVDVSSLDTKLILNDIPMENVEEVESSLKYFYDMQWVEMCNCGIPSEEMDALWKRHPDTRFVWMVQVGVCELRTDVTVFMPYQFGYDGYSKLYDQHTAELKYCVDLICMDMGHMGISDYSFLACMPHMQYLILADTKGDDFSVLAQLHELKFLEIFMTSFDQAEVLTGLTSLEDLNIGTSGLDNIEPLLEMTWLHRLWLPGNIHVSPEERALLRDTLTDTIVQFAGVGSTGAGWRESPNYYAMRDLLNMGYYTGW